MILVMNSIYRYDSTTGAFTVPPGGDGFYYFSTFLCGEYDKYGYFDIQIDGNVLCSIRVDQQQPITDFHQSACSAAIYAVEGRYPD